MMSRERALSEAFVELSDTLVADFDVVEFLHVLTRRCVQLLGVQAAGVMVADQRGALRVMASSSERSRLLELFEVESHAGPCVDCYATGEPVVELDLNQPDSRWSPFAGRALESGFRSVYALPMRLREEVVGVLNLFREEPGPLGEHDVRLGQALANVTTIGLLQHRAVEYRQVLTEQLQHALNSRVVIEQAKGVLAERLRINVDDAFDELRRYARTHRRRLSDVASDIITGDHTNPREPAGPVLLIEYFDQATLGALRAAVAHRGTRVGLDGLGLDKFVRAVHEAAVNAVHHGGGHGRLSLWRHGDSLWCEIVDEGSGMPDPSTVEQRPDTDPSSRRGLWLINQICASVDITSTASGTRLLLRYPLPAPKARPGD